MASVWNPTTLRYEENGQPNTVPTSPPIVATLEPIPNSRPMTGAPVDTAPDPVFPSDLEVGTVPGPPSQARRYASIDQDEPEPTGESVPVAYPKQSEPFPVAGDAPAGGPAAAPAKSAAPTGMVTTATSSTSGTEGDRMTAQGAERQGALDTDVDAEKQNSAARSEQDKELGKKNLQITKNANAQIASAQEETDRQVAAQEQVIARFEDHVEKKRQALESKPLVSFWASRTNAARFIAAISGAVGTYAATRSGGRNFAQERIDKAIDQDFKEQQAEIANNKDLLALAKQDVQAAEMKKKGLLYDLQIKKVALLDTAERTRAEELAAHGLATADIAKDEKLVAIQKKRDEEKANLKDSFVRDVKSYTVQKTPAAVLAAQQGANGDPMLVTDGAGRVLGRATTSPKAAEDARAALGGQGKFNSAANQMLALIQKNKGTAWTGEDAGKMSSLYGSLVGGARTALFPGGGTLDEGFVKLLDKMMDDPSGLSKSPRFQAQMIAKLTQTQGAVDEATKATLGAAGLKIGK